MWEIEKWKDKKIKLKQLLQPCGFYHSQVAAISLWCFPSHSVCGCGWHFFLIWKWDIFVLTIWKVLLVSIICHFLFYILSHWKTFKKREWERRQLRFCTEACFSSTWLLSTTVGRTLLPDHGPIASSTWALTLAMNFRDPKHWFNLMGAVELMIWKK